MSELKRNKRRNQPIENQQDKLKICRILRNNLENLAQFEIYFVPLPKIWRCQAAPRQSMQASLRSVCTDIAPEKDRKI